MKQNDGKDKDKNKDKEVDQEVKVKREPTPLAQQPIVAISSTKPYAIVTAATLPQQKSKPKTVADKIAHFEQLAKDNQPETGLKSKKP
ncbi:MAG TPA: hypothetical protein PLD88_13090 [Candidatus Berkiella sp.]|nr:hypothetical protein [Candidatus Berkiella sp.]